MKSLKCSRIALALLLFLSLPGLLPAQTLLHRYSFFSDASDSVGTANGILTGSSELPVSINNGLTLIGGFGSQVVQLPSGIISGATNLTIECWATQDVPQRWAAMWSFNTPSLHSFSFAFYPTEINGDMGIEEESMGSISEAQSSSVFPTGAEVYVVVTFDATKLLGALYTNGVQIASMTVPSSTYVPGNLISSTNLNYLGQDIFSTYSLNPQFAGTIYEFRIWNGVVSPLYQAVSWAAGPAQLVFNLTPTSVSVNVPGGGMVSGTSAAATATANFFNANGVTVTSYVTNWTSSNPSAVTVSSNGLVMAVAPGSATISATLNGVTGVSSNVTVSSAILPARGPISITTSRTNIVLSWTSGTLVQGPSLTGPWTTNSAAVSPYTTAIGKGNQFFKLAQ